MAVRTWIEDNKVHYRIYVKARGRGDRAIQSQKQETGIFKDAKPSDIEPVLSEEIRKKIQRIEIRLAGEARLEVARIEGAGILWPELVDRWYEEVLSDKEVLEFIGLSERSAEAYHQLLTDHCEGWRKKAASEITAADFELVMLAMTKQGYANSTKYNLKTAVSLCYKWGIKKRIIPNVSVPPTYGFSISRKNSRRPEVLNTSQIVSLLESAERLMNPWYYVWKFVLYTGLRSGEAYALKRKDLDREEKRIMLDTKYNFISRADEPLKDHEWRQVPINKPLDQMFSEMGVWDLRPDEFVLPRITGWKNGAAANQLRAFCLKVGVPSICFHTLRACWATQLLKNGESQSKVMIMGGWADLETMQVYLRRAGVEIEGGTDSLNFERRKERPGRILKIAGTRDVIQEESDFE